MSTDKPVAASSFWSELFQWGLYKKTQGRYARQATLGAMLVLVAVAAWRIHEELTGVGWFSGARFVLPAMVLGVGAWFSFRVINVPRFADFLIAVEAEMNKVSWPSRGELIRSSMVVIFVLFALSGVLFGFDIFWKFVFQLMGVLAPPSGGGSS